MGFSDDDLEDGGTDELVDALIAWGDADAIASEGPRAPRRRRRPRRRARVGRRQERAPDSDLAGIGRGAASCDEAERGRTSVREPENPIHQHAPQGSYWTTTNYEEAMPGIPTPLSWSIWRDGMNSGAAAAFRQLGFYPRGEQPAATGMFYGRMCGRIDEQCRALAGMPGFDPEVYAEHMYAIPRGELGITKTKRRLPIIAVKAPVAISTAPRTLRRIKVDAEAWWRRVINEPMDPARAVTTLQESVALFQRVLQVHSVTCTTVIPADRTRR